MTPRKASLRVAHQAKCANANKTAEESIGKGNGCTCSPSYYTFMRDRSGKVVKSARVKDRQVAQRALNKLQVEIDEKQLGLSRPKSVTFDEWAGEFEKITAGRVSAGDLKPRTLEAYKETIALARTPLGHVPLRDISTPELRAFYVLLEKTKPASRLRHLRQLSACMTAAVDEGHLNVNPVPVFTKKLKIKAPKRGKAPFDDNELVRLWAAYAEYEDVYGHSARFSAEAGLRLGELVALDWSNVDLTNARVLVEHTWDASAGLVAPKDREARTVHLTPYAKAVLEEWVTIAGVHTDGPVFPHPLTGGRLNARMMGRRIDTAMEDAGIPKQHPELRLPRSFHSLRYTTSVLMQRRGYHPRLIEQTLGHGTLELSFGVYGGWTPDMLAEEASRDHARSAARDDSSRS